MTSAKGKSRCHRDPTSLGSKVTRKFKRGTFPLSDRLLADGAVGSAGMVFSGVGSIISTSSSGPADLASSWVISSCCLLRLGAPETVRRYPQARRESTCWLDQQQQLTSTSSSLGRLSTRKQSWEPWNLKKKVKLSKKWPRQKSKLHNS